MVFPPTSRRDIRLEMPPEPEPSGFLDWSSLASLPARTSHHGALEVQAEQSNNARNQNQLNVLTARIDNSVQTEQVRENQNIPVRPIRSDLASNEENVIIIPPIPMQSAQSSLHAEDVVLPRIIPRESSTNDDLSRSSSQRRSHDVNIAGISSIHPVDSIRQSGIEDRGSGPTYQHEGIHLPRTSTVNRRDSSDSSDSDRFQRGRGYSHERGRPPERERYPSRDRDRRPSRRRGLPSNGRPPDRSPREPSGGRGPPDNGGPPDDGGPPGDGG